MFTPLRRFEFGKMLLNIVPVLIGSGFVSKIFTDFPWGVRLVFGSIIALATISGFVCLPESLSETDKKGGQS